MLSKVVPESTFPLIQRVNGNDFIELKRLEHEDDGSFHFNVVINMRSYTSSPPHVSCYASFKHRHNFTIAFTSLSPIVSLIYVYHQFLLLFRWGSTKSRGTYATKRVGPLYQLQKTDKKFKH